MAGKPASKVLGRKHIKVNRKISRSKRFKAGMNRGWIKSISYTETKSGKEAIKIEISGEYGEKGTFLITLGTDKGEILVDGLLDCINEDEADLEELEGVTIGFEVECKDSFLNLKSIFPVEDEEEEIDDELEDEELLDEDEYELEEE